MKERNGKPFSSAGAQNEEMFQTRLKSGQHSFFFQSPQVKKERGLKNFQ